MTKRKVCPRCGVEKTLAKATFVYATSKVSGVRLWKHCRLCDRKMQREARARVAANPYLAERRRRKRREYQRADRAKNPDKYRTREREWRHRLKAAHPELWAEVYVMPKRFLREGRSLSRSAHVTKYDAYEDPRWWEVGVDAEPLVTYLRDTFPGWSAWDIYQQTHHAVSDRLLRALLDGDRPRLALDSVDRFLTIGLGRPDLLNALYPMEAR